MNPMQHLSEAQAVLTEWGFMTHPRPWIGHTARELSKVNTDKPWEGDEADFTGFRQWMEDRFDERYKQSLTHQDGPEACNCMTCEDYFKWDNMDMLERVALYGELNNVALQVAEMMGWHEPNR